ncbi:MAG: exodeoxyribonuclease III [Deltaproteobacteria bacterium]|nr:exodeoxyribonuclease III [Deltaproteobacteria bacterium]
MKIISFNVNGFRSAVKKGFHQWFSDESPDILSLQEIRAEWSELTDEDRALLSSEHDVCWFPASKKPGYSGCATLVRKGLGCTQSPGVGVPEFDEEGRLVVTEHPAFSLIAGYFPNASEKLSRLDYKQRFSQWLTAEIARRTDKPLIIVGDLNVAPEAIDIARPDSNHKSPGFTDEEREDFRAYLRAGMVDVLRERQPTTEGLYTWWSVRGGARARNVGWRLDIFLVSPSLTSHVRSIEHQTHVMLSDHCPIALTLEGPYGA